MLERFLADETPDNIRIRKSVIDAFLKHGWVVKNPSVFVEGRVVGKVYVEANGTLVFRK
jgi:hypothetical protein